jgi:NodT family efflux transporter outer membrane factor (OMF) lipoprotein
MNTNDNKPLLFRRNNLVLVLTCASLLSSCMVGPNYKRPNLLVPPKFKEQKGPTQVKLIHAPKDKIWKPIQSQNNCERSKWWTVFKDPVLNDLEEQLNRYNQNIVNAYENYQVALAIVDEARAALFPSLTGALSVFRQKTGSGTTSFISSSAGTTTAGTASTTATGISTTATTYSALLSTSWEPDIWGVVRRTIESDVAAAQSNAALLVYTRLSAQGALAQYYFELRTLDTNQKLLDDTVKAYKKTLQLTRNQYTSGIAARSDVVQAQVQLENEEALALNNGILRGQYEHAIAVLMGRPPANLTLKFMPLDLKLPVIPLEVPTVWLERRPDIAEAERLVQKASALIGVAIAAYYPAVTLTGSGSAAGRAIHQLIHTPSLGWSVGLQAAETLFDGGLRSATVRAAKSAYFAQVAAYRQTVLTAFQNVEDNLIALRILRAQLKVQNKAAKDATFALKLVLNQYKAGTVNFVSVLTAQVAAYTAQQTANQDAGLLMSSEVGLLIALGGGWDAKSLCCAIKH